MFFQCPAAAKFLQFLQAARSPPRQEWQQAQLPRLQRLVGIQKRFQEFFMTRYESSLLVLRLARFALQFFQLEGDFSLRRLHRSCQRGIESDDLLLELREHAFRLLDARVKILRQRFRHAGSFHLPPQFLRAGPHVFDLQVVVSQQLFRFRIQQREPGTRQDDRHSAQQMPIDHFRLREVRNLRGARDVRGRRQQIILDHGPQQRIRTEAFRLRLDQPEQFFASPRGIPRLKFPVAHSNGLPQTFAHEEEQRAS